MTRVPIFNRANEPIESLSDWELRASPGPGRWAEGYSAHALAKAWVEGRGAEDLLVLLRGKGDGDFDGLGLERAIAEAQTRFDQWGGPRNHDLLVWASDDGGRFPICVEAKVNEAFGETLEEYRAAADSKQKGGEPTNAPERLAGLAESIAGSNLDDRPELGGLRYQLFSATAGTVAEAVEGRAVFIVHEFQTLASDPKAQSANAADLSRFLDLVFGVEPPGSSDWLVGPLRIAKSTERLSADTDLWVGHLSSA
jgi:Domain of unknown function (DUF6946)